MEDHMRYAIADYLTQEQKERAVGERYVGRPPRNKKGICVLGVALGFSSTPGVQEIVWKILDLGQGRNMPKAVIYDAANAVILDFENGMIPKLSVALGLS